MKLNFPKPIYDPKITLGNLISIAVFLIAGITAVIRAEYRLSHLEREMLKHDGDLLKHIPVEIQSRTYVPRIEYEKDTRIMNESFAHASADRMAVRTEVRSIAVELKEEFRSVREQSSKNFDSMTRRMDQIYEKIK